MEETESVDMVKPPGKQDSDSTQPTKDGINNIPSSKIYEEDNTEAQDNKTSRLEEKESTKRNLRGNKHS